MVFRRKKDPRIEEIAARLRRELRLPQKSAENAAKRIVKEELSVDEYVEVYKRLLDSTKAPKRQVAWQAYLVARGDASLEEAEARLRALAEARRKRAEREVEEAEKKGSLSERLRKALAEAAERSLRNPPAFTGWAADPWGGWGQAPFPAASWDPWADVFPSQAPQPAGTQRSTATRRRRTRRSSRRRRR